MTVLAGGLRVLGANHDASELGVPTGRPGALPNDIFVNLTDLGTDWHPSSDAEQSFAGSDRQTGGRPWTASRVDLAFGANPQLRALAEVYGGEKAQRKFVEDLPAAWDRVMRLDRSDLD